MQNANANANVKFFKIFNAAGRVMSVHAIKDDRVTAEALTAEVANLGGYAVEVTDLEERAMLRDQLARQ